MKVVIISVCLSYLLMGITDKKVIIMDREVREESLYRSNGGNESIYLKNEVEHELPGRI
jgi:hypothetical protein